MITLEIWMLPIQDKKALVSVVTYNRIPPTKGKGCLTQPFKIFYNLLIFSFRHANVNPREIRKINASRFFLVPVRVKTNQIAWKDSIVICPEPSQQV